MISYKEVQNAIKALQNYCSEHVCEHGCGECEIKDLCYDFFIDSPAYWTDEESEG